MADPVTFFVEGAPKGQPRPRAFVRGNRAAVYDPGTAEGWKSCVAVAARPHLPKSPITVPVTLGLQFYFPRPKSHYRTGKNAAMLRDDCPHQHTGKPDVDNLAKAVMDAMTALGFWRDDGQVWRLSIEKTYGTQVGCFVRVSQGYPP